MQFTGNELILAHNTLKGLFKLADLMQHIQDTVVVPSSNQITDINFTVDTGLLQNGEFTISVVPTPEQQLNHVRYMVLGTNKLTANAFGRIFQDQYLNDTDSVPFAILVVADGFSKILYALMTKSNNTFELYTRDTPYINES